MTVTAVAPGRVNLIGEHTDTTGGLVLPMAIDLATTIAGQAGGDEVVLRSADEALATAVPLDVGDPAAQSPAWARYVAGVVAELRPDRGFTGTVTTTLPVGAGLSSSSALTVAVAVALGFEGTPLELALACQRAERRSSGVPGGIMDQLASAAGVEGHALLIDCHALTVEPVALPPDAEIVVVHSGQARRLVDSAYGERRAECERAEQQVGPLRLIDDVAALAPITDDVVRRRARHVVTENLRVRAFVAAVGAHDLPAAGALMAASHASLRDDFAVSTEALDRLVARLSATPGVYGARLTGAGFGGCVVVLAASGAIDEGWTVRPSAGARRILG